MKFTEVSRIALPMIVAQLASSAMGFVDTLLMGKLGVDVLAGAGLGAVVYQFVFIVSLGVLVATSNLIAFAHGQEDDRQIQQSLLSGVVATLVMFVLCALVLWNTGPLLLMMGQTPELVGLSVDYLRHVVWALLPALGFILLRSLALGLGRPGNIWVISIAAAVANYPVSYALMTGWGGLPVLGLHGIAYGTVIVSVFMFLLYAISIYRQEDIARFPFWREWQAFDLSQLIETVRLGVPIALAHALEVGMFSVAAIMIGWLGAAPLAAHQIALQCAALAFMIPLGISQGVSVLAGRYFGARQLEKIREVTHTGVLMGVLNAIVIAGVLLLFPEQIVHWFIQPGAEQFDQVMAIGVSLLGVAAMFQLVDGLQVIMMGALRGLKLGAAPTAISFVGYWVIGFSISYGLLESLQAQGVWVGLGLGLAAAALMLTMLFMRTMRQMAIHD